MTVKELIERLAKIPESDHEHDIRVLVIEDGAWGTHATFKDIESINLEQKNLYEIELEI